VDGHRDIIYELQKPTIGVQGRLGRARDAAALGLRARHRHSCFFCCHLWAHYGRLGRAPNAKHTLTLSKKIESLFFWEETLPFSGAQENIAPKSKQKNVFFSRMMLTARRASIRRG
jgi:hypothetical protein